MTKVCDCPGCTINQHLAGIIERQAELLRAYNDEDSDALDRLTALDHAAHVAIAALRPELAECLGDE